MDLINDFISRKFNSCLNSARSHYKYTVTSPVNPPLEPKILSVKFLKEWKGKTMYLAEYADGFAIVIKGEEIRKQVSRDEWLDFLEKMFLEIVREN